MSDVRETPINSQTFDTFGFFTVFGSETLNLNLHLWVRDGVIVRVLTMCTCCCTPGILCVKF